MSGFPSACATAPASSSSGASRSPSATTRRATASSSPRSWRTICPPRKFVSFATALADRLDAERAGMSVPPEGEPPADGETPAFDPGLISV